jgi:hypothetical protein
VFRRGREAGAVAAARVNPLASEGIDNLAAVMPHRGFDPAFAEHRNGARPDCDRRHRPRRSRGVLEAFAAARADGEARLELEGSLIEIDRAERLPRRAKGLGAIEEGG